jgi:cytoskeletal protein CcmA (bactofilin family)
MRRLFLALCATMVSLSILAPAAQAAPDRGATPGEPSKHVTRIGPLKATVETDGDSQESVAVGADAHVAAGQVHEGDLVTVLGDVQIDGTVTGDVVVVLGSLELNGTVEGDVVAIMSPPLLDESARIKGDLVSVGRAVDLAPGSRVDGQVVNLGLSKLIPFAEHGVGLSWLAWVFFLCKLARLAAFFLILLLLVALVPRRLSVIAAALPRRWGYALLIGLAAWAGVTVGFFILLITVIGIPLAIALLCAAQLIKWIGLASILFLMGQTASRNLFNRDPTHLAAALGGFAVYAIACLIPLVGSLFGFAMGALALGIALITRFGSEESPLSGGGARPPVREVIPPPPVADPGPA